VTMHITSTAGSAKPVSTSKVAAKKRTIAWCRIIDSAAEMREALDYRIWREDPNDRFLQADCQAWCELTKALADFLGVRRAA